MLNHVEICPGEFLSVISEGTTKEKDEEFMEYLKEAVACVPLPCREAIITHYRLYPFVIFCPRKQDMITVTIAGKKGLQSAPIAMANRVGRLLSCDASRILDLPGKRPWGVFVLVEELAHAYLIATQHPSHMVPSTDFESVEAYEQYHAAMEARMREEAQRWGIDIAEFDKATEWIRQPLGDSTLHNSQTCE